MKNLVWLLLNTFAYGMVPINYITEYFNQEQIKFVTLVACWGNYDYKQLSESLNNNFITHSLLRINENFNSNLFITLPQFIKVRNTKHVFLLDLDCEHSLDILNMPIKNGRFDSNFDLRLKWILLSKEDIDTFTKSVEYLKFRLDSDITFAEYVNDTFMGYKIYHTGHNKTHGKLLYYQEHTFNYKTGDFMYINNQTFYKNRKDLNGVALKTITVVTKNYTGSPESFLEESNALGVDTINKLNFALFKHIIVLHNFRMVLNITRLWYGNSPSGIDGGLSQILWLKKSDISATAALMFAEKVPVLDYVSATYYFGTCFLFRNPSAIGKIRNPFFEPFASSTWIISILFCIIISTCLKISYTLHSRYISNKVLQHNDNGRWSSCLLNTVAAVCQQDIEIHVNYITQRILVLSTMLLSLILYNYYTSSIVSDLINSQPQAFKTLHELVDSSMQLGSEDAPYTRRILKNSQDEDFIRLRNTKIEPLGKPEQYMKPSEGIKRVKDGGFAYHLEATVGYYLVAKSFEAGEICDLKEIYFINKTWIYLATQKNSEYKLLLSVSYAKIRERGILDREIKIWRFPKPQCLSNANILQIELEQVAIAFCILLFGIVASIIILIIEIKSKRVSM